MAVVFKAKAQEAATYTFLSILSVSTRNNSEYISILKMQEANSKPRQHAHVTADERAKAEAGYRWGKTPSSEKQGSEPSKMPPDHPVHNIPIEKQDLLRQKGINPVLKAEMDEATKGRGKERSFWSKYAMNALGRWTR